MGELRCLTVRQPYASLIAHGAKWIETRSWQTHYRGPVAIHAAKADTDNDLSIPVGAWDALGRVIGGEAPIRGAVVAVARLVDCVPIVEEDEDLHIDQPCIEVRPPTRTTNSGVWLWIRGENEDSAEDVTDQVRLGVFWPGRWGWLLSGVRRLEPIRARGRQGLWRPDHDLRTAIGQQLHDQAVAIRQQLEQLTSRARQAVADCPAPPVDGGGAARG